MSMACNQACPYNTLNGCKVNEYGAICPMSNMVFEEKPMTNADRIRAMTDEELAKECVKQFPMYLWPSEVRTIYFDFENHNKNNAINAWLEWLQQPAKGDA